MGILRFQIISSFIWNWETHGEKEIFICWSTAQIYTPARAGQALAGSRRFFPHGSRDMGTCGIFAAFFRTLAGSWIGHQSSQNLAWCPLGMQGTQDAALPARAHGPPAEVVILSSPLLISSFISKIKGCLKWEGKSLSITWKMSNYPCISPCCDSVSLRKCLFFLPSSVLIFKLK